MVMEDYHQIDSMMDGQPYKAGYHAATLRRYLWREHLGLLPAQDVDASKDPNTQPPDVAPNDIREDDTYEFVKDPLSDQVWDMWTGNATKNLEMFRHLFRADPDDNSKSYTNLHYRISLSFTSLHATAYPTPHPPQPILLFPLLHQTQ